MFDAGQCIEQEWKREKWTSGPYVKTLVQIETQKQGLPSLILNCPLYIAQWDVANKILRLRIERGCVYPKPHALDSVDLHVHECARV